MIGKKQKRDLRRQILGPETAWESLGQAASGQLALYSVLGSSIHDTAALSRNWLSDHGSRRYVTNVAGLIPKAGRATALFPELGIADLGKGSPI